jgi:nitric-oxide synthase, bacterial
MRPLNYDSGTACPYSKARASSAPPLTGFDRRWDPAESAEMLCPERGLLDTDLASCAKEAWRNSVRCIGRRIWKALHVIDGRSLEGPDEIFEALLTHIKKATNGGQILPVMSVFREWSAKEHEIRIWNHQLIRYAGYGQSNGTTLGDPMNRELTQIAIALGWRPPFTPGPFDLLPLIIQVGQKLCWYELPAQEVLEVKIRHPRYPFFEKMGLRWYTVPAVSDMIFATGASLHPCAPFNGHYMGTEIGARNLGDTDRYNYLPEMAVKLGLDTTTSRTLWKDHALVVLNEAVLWSFDSEGVRIADHHSASDDFLRFCEKEKKANRDVSADWNWIVPPISGAATPVFHRNYDLKPVYPNFLLQVPAWETERGQKILASNRTGTSNSKKRPLPSHP